MFYDFGSSENERQNSVKNYIHPIFLGQIKMLEFLELTYLTNNTAQVT